MMRRRQVVAVLVGMALSTALAAGGPIPAPAAASTRSAASARAPFPGKGPRAILNLSAATMGKARSVHVRDRFVLDGAVASSDWVVAASAGTGTCHTMFGGTFRVIRVGSNAWLRGDEAFWRGKDAPEAYVGHWVRLTSADYRGFAAFTYLGEWTKQISAQRPVKRVTGRTLHGLPTLGLRDGSGIVVYVATKGKPYPQLLTFPTVQGQSETVEYDRWDARVVIAPPAADQVVGSI